MDAAVGAIQNRKRRRGMAYIVKENKDGTVTISRSVYDELHRKAEDHDRIVEYIT